MVKLLHLYQLNHILSQLCQYKPASLNIQTIGTYKYSIAQQNLHNNLYKTGRRPV